MNIRKWCGDVNKVRAGWSIIYLILGLILFALRVFVWGISRFPHMEDILWIFSWSCIGIGAGLLNSRENKKGDRINQHLHYIIYYLFAFFVSSLSAFALSRKGDVLDYPQSALIALALGFAAERINDLAPI